MSLTPAECVFHAFGGVNAVARILNVCPSTVSRWMVGVHKGERARRSGAVPTHHARTLVEEAARRGKVLTLAHLMFGRESVTEGVVTVRNGRRVEVRPHG